MLQRGHRCSIRENRPTLPTLPAQGTQQRETGHAAQQRADQVQCRVGQCPANVAVLQQRHRFTTEAGKGRQATEETGNDEQAPVRRQPGLVGKERERAADQEATEQVGRQCADLDKAVQAAQPQGQAPAQPGANGGAEPDREKIQRACHRARAVSSVTRASTQRAPSGVSSFFQNGASVFR
jgi:hypothetical protein